MSGVNISYEIASGGGEIKYYEDTSLNPKEAPNLANVIAGEIVNEILENALDIATRASDTGIHWKEIKESRSRASMNPSLVTEMDSKKQRMNESHMDSICTNIVGDIVEHIGIPSAPNISEIIDGLNNISINQDTKQDKQEAVPLDVEMKKLLAEMLSSPYEIINYDNLPAKGGIGDQPSEKSNNVANEPAAEPEVPKVVEKKSRVTDLVKNSPHIISEYLMMDELAKQNQEQWEESTEQLLQVIELDHVKPGEELFRVQKTVFPEKVALPEDDGEEDELIQMPSDDMMDIVDLSSDAFKEEQRQLSSGNSTGAKGDDRKSDNVVITGIPSEAASSGGEIMETSLASYQKQIAATSNDTADEQQKSKKKKWNFGTRLWGFLKKSHKPHEQGSSTSTQKPL